ncbi:hypothetical protein Hanom_Chr16g01431411 [Helianthus anomalus]
MSTENQEAPLLHNPEVRYSFVRFRGIFSTQYKLHPLIHTLHRMYFSIIITSTC